MEAERSWSFSITMSHSRMSSNAILLFLLSCYTLCMLANAATITIGPQDTYAIVGGNTTLYCTVDGLGSDTVVWREHQTDNEYSENRTIVTPIAIEPERFKITGDNADGTFNLHITNIDLFVDKKEYQCTIYENGLYKSGSEGALLGVYDEPMSPTCTVESYDNLQEGDTVTFQCTFGSRIPQVEMNLTSNFNTLLNKIVDPDPGPGTSIALHSFVVAAEDDGAVLRCTVDNKIFNMPYECSVTINVKHKPIVEITQNGMLSDGNASFTCGAISNPSATQFKWNLCLGDTDMECIDPGEGTLTLEQDDSDGLPTECEVFGSNVFCKVFKNGETELPVYVIIIDDNLIIPENMTVTPCLLECSVMNEIGEGKDNFTIDDTICVIAIEPTTILTETSKPTSVSLLTTRTFRPTDSEMTSDQMSTKNPVDCSCDGSLDGWVYFIIGFTCGVLCLLLVIILLRLLKHKTNITANKAAQDMSETPEPEYENLNKISQNNDNYMDLTTSDVTGASAYMELTPTS